MKSRKALSEKDIKKQMGDRYHVCDKCSVYNSLAAREMCLMNIPATRGDVAWLLAKLTALLKEGKS